ncbi:hypothetical protein PC116_g20085 [Phytophthora cactorum]|uniref:Uncharacterized protein n=2 Tax=Phytophthora cactorum TaxID=29920 RepID=A0A329SJU1_9STRA|nr:hypothetical protein Pcac1_g3098 [Phytophthora cactorum]KAG2811269.1 hypothetical protein PC112_g15683 [Phytophthora cactorum]KAG2812172.1 hypothetical protein PC111_g14910 [Phytophthora cactorum]KAG2851540.1 hypothetical protein PC113_g15824 [Phytophthora cactorum]KAG2919551.1 hypothetical protein PC117_g16738 [Phytophthora cactorum]
MLDAPRVPRSKRRCRASKKKRHRLKIRASLEQIEKVVLKDDAEKQTQAHTESDDQVQHHRKQDVEVQRPQQQNEVLQYGYSPKQHNTHVQVPAQDREEGRRSREDEHNGDEDERRRANNQIARTTTGNEAGKEIKRQRLAEKRAARSAQQVLQQRISLEVRTKCSENMRVTAPSIGVAIPPQEEKSLPGAESEVHQDNIEKYEKAGEEHMEVAKFSHKHSEDCRHTQTVVLKASVPTIDRQVHATTGNRTGNGSKRHKVDAAELYDFEATQRDEFGDQIAHFARKSIQSLAEVKSLSCDDDSPLQEKQESDVSSRYPVDHVDNPGLRNQEVGLNEQQGHRQQELDRAESCAFQAVQENEVMSQVARLVYRPEKIKSVEEKKLHLGGANSPKPLPRDSVNQFGILGSSYNEVSCGDPHGRDTDANGLDGDEMTEYERKRRDTILRNQAFLEQVGMSAARAGIRYDAEAKAKAKKEALAVKRALRAVQHAELPKRKSQRLSGEKMPVLTHSMELGHQLDVLSVKTMRQPQGSKLYVMDINDEEGEKFCKEIVGGVDVLKESPILGVADNVKYSLADNDAVKALPYRTTTMAFLPRVDRLVVAAGDKEGHIALWSPSTDASSSMAALSRPHGYPVSSLIFPDPSTLLSSSIDGTVREFDLATAQSSLLCDIAEETGITSLIGSGNPQFFYASCEDGTLRLVDRRARKIHSACYALHRKKITSVDQHPSLDFCIATTSMDAAVCLWDKRMISPEQCVPLAKFRHRNCVLSANFSPQDGSWLAVMGQSSYFDIYNLQTLDKCEKSDGNLLTQNEWIRVPHNTKTGTSTKPRPAWDPRRTSRFVIGCIDQPPKLQFYEAGHPHPIQELRQTKASNFDVVNVYHPHLDLIASGNLSGYLSLWRAKSVD